ncbi:MAG: ATP-dependent Clp protease ATP-binding subunit [Parcubacteria group bacterium]|jgi:ATP-dependent Clp protease ATP-binding subunit ClpC
MENIFLKTGFIYDRLSERAKKATFGSQKPSSNKSFADTSIASILSSVLEQKGSIGGSILASLGVTFQKIEKISVLSEYPLRSEIGRILTDAFGIASRFQYPYVGTEHLVFACLLGQNSESEFILSKLRVKRKDVEEKLHLALGGSKNLPSILKMFDLSENLADLQKTTKREKSPLASFGRNLNDQSKKEERIIGRDKELERIINILSRKNKNNPLLIGNPGVGKTAIVQELARRIETFDAPPALIGKKIVSLDMGLIVAGTSFRGEFEARLKSILEETRAGKNIILFIDEVHNIIGAGNSPGSLDAANILKPALANGEIQIIGATTLEEYKKHIEKDAALDRRFQTILIKDPALDECVMMIAATKKSYENFHGVSINESAIRAAVELSHRHISSRHLPDKALDLLDEAAAWKKTRSAKEKETVIKKIELEHKQDRIRLEKKEMVITENYEKAIQLKDLEKQIELELKKLSFVHGDPEKSAKKAEITDRDIAAILSLQTGIPLSHLQIKSGLGAVNLNSTLLEKIVNQKEAIHEIASVLKRAEAGLASRHRPLGSFLFLGPTGVGKTHTARVLADSLFLSEDSLIKIDMSEFMEKHNVARLLGAPAGYVGYGEGGILTEKVRHNPFSVILFDEIEKAHPDILNILLQILEDGKLTDAQGKPISFKNSIVVLTSNLGSHEFILSKSLGFSGSQKNPNDFDHKKNKIVENVKKDIRPELLNRLDKTIVLNPLGVKDLEKIARIELGELRTNLEKNGFELIFKDDLVKYIAKQSFNIAEGARLIRKNIQNLIENKLAGLILQKINASKKFKIAVKKNKIDISSS